MRKLLLLIAIMAVVALSAATPFGKCGANEEWSHCANDCAGNCANPNPTACHVHGHDCRSDCKCKDGYVRRSFNLTECILKTDCPTNFSYCGENEIYHDCINEIKPCPDPNGRIIHSRPLNLNACIKGCKCKDGYKRDRNSRRCVLGDRCKYD